MAVRAEIALEMWKKKVAQNKIVASTRNLFAQVIHPACVITKQRRSFILPLNPNPNRIKCAFYLQKIFVFDRMHIYE